MIIMPQTAEACACFAEKKLHPQPCGSMLKRGEPLEEALGRLCSRHPLGLGRKWLRREEEAEDLLAGMMIYSWADDPHARTASDLLWATMCLAGGTTILDLARASSNAPSRALRSLEGEPACPTSFSIHATPLFYLPPVANADATPASRTCKTADQATVRATGPSMPHGHPHKATRSHPATLPYNITQLSFGSPGRRNRVGFILRMQQPPVGTPWLQLHHITAHPASPIIPHK